MRSVKARSVVTTPKVHFLPCVKQNERRETGDSGLLDDDGRCCTEPAGHVSKGEQATSVIGECTDLALGWKRDSMGMVHWRVSFRRREIPVASGISMQGGTVRTHVMTHPARTVMSSRCVPWRAADDRGENVLCPGLRSRPSASGMVAIPIIEDVET
jgi:hypothetical protein